MSEISRRSFRKAGAAATALPGIGDPASAQQGVGTGDTFDLIIKGGEVLDPSQNLRARCDIGIRNRVIAGFAPHIPPERGAQVIDAI